MMAITSDAIGVFFVSGGAGLVDAQIAALRLLRTVFVRHERHQVRAGGSQRRQPQPPGLERVLLLILSSLAIDAWAGRVRI